MAMTLRPTAAQTEALRKTAEAEGRSMQAVALEAIDEYTSRRIERRDALIAKIVHEDAGLFDRLSRT